MYGNVFISYLKEGQTPTVWDETKAINANAKPSPAMGFAFDPSAVQTEIASLSAVIQEYVLSLSTGAVDPDRIMSEFLAKLDGAGAKKLQAEVQRQLDVWKVKK
jgi:putative aldouronate transport system substrate-binding protein